MRDIASIVDITTDLQIANPQASLEIDRDAAARFNVTPEQTQAALYNAYGSRQVSTIYTPTNEYWVILELFARIPEDLSALDSSTCARARAPNFRAVVGDEDVEHPRAGC